MKKRLKRIVSIMMMMMIGVIVFLAVWFLPAEKEPAQEKGMERQEKSIMEVVQSTPLVKAESSKKQETKRPDTLTLYPDYPEQIMRSSDYEVSVSQGGYTGNITVYDRSTCVEPWRGRAEKPDRYRRFCEFAFEGDAVTIRVKPAIAVESFRVLSSSGKITGIWEDGAISIALKEPENFLIELNGDYNTLLSIFADKPEKNVPKPGKKVTYIKGYHEPKGGVLTIDKPGTTIYLTPGSVLCARVTVKAKNVRIIGRGIVLDPWSNLLTYDLAKAQNKKLIDVRGSNVLIQDIKLLDARNYNLWADFGVKQLKAINVKVLSTAVTTDGLTLLDTKDSLISGCFFYCGDNAIVFEEDLSGTKIENCMIGTTCAALFPQQDIAGDILFDGIYVFRADEGIMNNRYNNKEYDRKVNTVTVQNLNAVDCRNLPWFFHGRYMGAADKQFTLKEIHLPKLYSVMSLMLDQPGSLIRIDNYDEDRQTGGYRINFENLYVDGVRLEHSEQLSIKDEKNYNNTYEVKTTGEYQPKMPMQQIAVNSELPQPAEQREDLSRNLLAERNAPYASIWWVGYSYTAGLSIKKAAKDLNYRLYVLPHEYNRGLMVTSLDITEKELTMAKSITLHFEASSREQGQAVIKLYNASGSNPANLEKIIDCSKNWESYELKWTLEELRELLSTEESDFGGVELEIIPAGEESREILFRNFEMKMAVNE